MNLSFASINWLAILACVVAGQVILTVWFVALFAKPWAVAYGGEGTTPKQHTQAVPGYTYGIGAVCVLLLSLGVSVLQTALGVNSVGDALQLGLFLALSIFVAMAMPAYAFLRRWSAWFISAGSQITLICVLSVILALWR
jgi:hypothetical protein